jgi:hypothetical protein
MGWSSFPFIFVDSFFQNEISCETVSPNYEFSKLDLMLIGFEILFFRTSNTSVIILVVCT